MTGLDATNVKILEILQDDASPSIAEIAERVHLSQNACWRRIRQLEEDGFIRKRVALLDAEKLGVGTTVFVMIRAAEYTDEWFDDFAAVCGVFRRCWNSTASRAMSTTCSSCRFPILPATTR